MFNGSNYFFSLVTRVSSLIFAANPLQFFFQDKNTNVSITNNEIKPYISQPKIYKGILMPKFQQKTFYVLLKHKFSKEYLEEMFQKGLLDQVALKFNEGYSIEKTIKEVEKQFKKDGIEESRLSKS